MKKIVLTLVGGIAALGLSFGVTAASADEQGTGLQIVRVDYNVKGVDTSANAYQESVRVQNKGATPASLAGCTLEDLTGHTYHFPASFSLAPGAYVNVRTGKSPSTDPANWWNSPVNLYWNRTSHMYGNSSDSVTLECGGSRLDRVAWNDFAIRP
ncbi:lamin tail domain-containing protein [Thermoactinospora rubra]|uniref:lamin tail domain-containing protein n=1 Tax=Thermoactinospora rubra TaxID=1088767 RepID=UPI000A116027|nr:lamin tail domain-containing protein [Thermoactinospora rubra]